MAVRRLHTEQPDGFAFTKANLAWARKQIAKYPEGRQASAVIPLLWRAQEQEGWVSEPAIRAIADMLDMPYIRVLEVATFYTMFHLAPVGRKAHVQVCGTTPCMLRGSEELIAVCKHRIAEVPHTVSADGDFSWEEVECLGACVNAPMVQVFSDTYEDLTAESFEALLDAFARGETPNPGPQVDRLYSAPQGELTTLTEAEATKKKPARRTAAKSKAKDETEHPEPATPKARRQRVARPKTDDKPEAEAARTPGKDQAATKPARRKATSPGRAGGKKDS
jgi:NADH-quinone oxidoreductase subunit E